VGQMGSTMVSLQLQKEIHCSDGDPLAQHRSARDCNLSGMSLVSCVDREPRLDCLCSNCAPALQSTEVSYASISIKNTRK
jgi:hypothetical protein